MWTKVCIVKAMVFPVIMYGCESWTIKKAECRRTDVFELWCWRRFLKVPQTAKRSDQSTLKEISPEYSLEGLMLKLKRQYFGPLMWRTDSFEKTLLLGKIEDRRRRGRQRMRWLDGITNSMDMKLVNSGSWWWIGRPGVLHAVAKSWTRLSDWTELITLQVTLVVKNSSANAGRVKDKGSISQSGRSPGRGHDNPLLYSCLENPMDRRVWQATVHGVTKSQTRLKRQYTGRLTWEYISFSCWITYLVYFPPWQLLLENLIPIRKVFLLGIVPLFCKT